MQKDVLWTVFLRKKAEFFDFYIGYINIYNTNIKNKQFPKLILFDILCIEKEIRRVYMNECKIAKST